MQPRLKAWDPKKTYRPSGFVVVRSALLPFTELVRWNEEEGAGAESIPGGDSAQAVKQAVRSYGAKRKNVVRRLAQIYSRAEVRESLFFASRHLESKLDDWLLNPGDDSKMDLALARYLARMAGRETPFGTFGGISLGRVARDTCLEVGALTTYRRHTRPTMGYVTSLLSTLAARDDISGEIAYQANSTLHQAFGRWRFASVGGPKQQYPVVDVEPTPHLQRALAHARLGATSSEIASALETLGFSRTAGLRFAHVLVQHGLLVPSWLPAVSGPEPFDGICRALEAHPSLRSAGTMLRSVSEHLVNLDRSPIGHELAGLRTLASALEQGSYEHGFECAQMLQADLIKPAPSLTLSDALVQRLLRAAEIVQRTAAPHPNKSLETFCTRFVSRYGSRQVALVEALDPDLGLGFGDFQRRATDAVLYDLDLHSPPSRDRSYTALDELRLFILTQALESGSLEFEIGTQLLALFPEREVNPFPESFAVSAQLARNGERLTIVAPTVMAPCAMMVLARFCHADPALEQAVRAHIAAERAGAGPRVLADVAHFPAGQVGNILLRPVLRDFEIVYDGKSGASADRQIHISDLYVEVTAGRVTLHSKQLGRQVAVRITNAHNVDGWWNPPIYRFLGALQEADRGGLAGTWSWGMLESSAFLPRVVCEGVVLCRARWCLWADDLATIFQKAPSDAFAALQMVRARLRLPRWVALLERETPLVLDLENVLSVECLARESRHADHIVLQELLPTPAELALTGPEGSFVSEVIVPFVRQSVAAPEAPDNFGPFVERQSENATQRSFAPGSEWLYVKLYAGFSAQDDVLKRFGKGVLPGLPRHAKHCWFFVPYIDPEPHLRLRIRGPAEALLAFILPQLRQCLAPLLETRAIHRFQIDTYEREVERYGGFDGIDIAEEAFMWDSEASMHSIALCDGDAELRWRVTLVGVDRLLCDFGYTLPERAEFATAVMMNYRHEFGVDNPTLKKIGVKYRLEATRLSAWLWPRDTDSNGAEIDARMSRALGILGERSRRLTTVAARFERAAAVSPMSIDHSAIVQSLVHMWVTRMLGPSSRSHELVIYDFLRRQYSTRIALRSSSRPHVEAAGHGERDPTGARTGSGGETHEG